MLVVCVYFEIKPVFIDAFLEVMRKNALASLKNEIGCHQFDVNQDPLSPNSIFLYELYEDAAAFELHKQTDHYLEFNEAIAPMIIGKTLRILKRMEIDSVT